MHKWRVVEVLGLCIGMAGAIAACDSNDKGGKSNASKADKDQGDDAGEHDSARDAGEESVTGTRITIGDGTLNGVTQGGTRAFLGIPYAKPPVAELRWKAPQKLDKWQGERDASQFGKRCAQLASTTLQNGASEDEDCLYLNVWTAAPKGKKLPVMVWIHGGGNVNGSASEPIPFLNTGYFYSGQKLAENNGVVVVTFNYRLGVFGFLAHAGLGSEGSKSGNQGLWDQRAVFEWVQQNIAQFGGDASNVTIFGESAGSLDVCLHVAAANTKGLFTRAISESGGCTTLQTTKDQAETSGAAFAKQLGCDGDDALGCLRGKSVDDLLNAKPPAGATGQGFGPVVDGDLLPDQPRTLYDSGAFAKVPYILGSNTDEGTLFVTDSVSTQEQLTAALKKSFGDLAQQVADTYPIADFKDAMPNPFQAVLARASGDEILVCSTYDAALRATKSSPAVYMYNFDIPVDPTLSSTYLGVTHGSELSYVFGTSPNFTPEQQKASDRIQQYWTDFAKTGDPNGASDTAWPKFTESSNVRMNLGIDATVVNDFRAKACDFWRAQYDKQFNQ
jgi:para-nitrobenzyl esterase